MNCFPPSFPRDLSLQIFLIAQFLFKVCGLCRSGRSRIHWRSCHYTITPTLARPLFTVLANQKVGKITTESHFYVRLLGNELEPAYNRGSCRVSSYTQIIVTTSKDVSYLCLECRLVLVHRDLSLWSDRLLQRSPHLEGSLHANKLSAEQVF